VLDINTTDGSNKPQSRFPPHEISIKTIAKYEETCCTQFLIILLIDCLYTITRVPVAEEQKRDNEH
jgi:hypothetical protein